MEQGMALTQEEFEQRIQQNFLTLSKRLQQVARFILEHPNEIAFGTVANIAKNAGVHASALIRFSKAFDFEGFSDMQKVFKNRLLDNVADYPTRIKAVEQDSDVNPDTSCEGWLKRICEANIQASKAMCHQIDGKSLSSATNLINGAQIIHLQGACRSFPVTTYFGYLLSNIGKRAHVLDGIGQMNNMQQAMMTKEDVLFVVSFHPYAEETQQIAEHAREVGTPIILLTDSPLNPLTEMANISIRIKEAEIHSFRSLNGSMNLIQALTLGIIDTNRQTESEN
jgi:DNA-binding MurR/RpiR family transcriptional regulator